jgi:ribonuclease VapC
VIFVDASAIVAILLREPGHESLLDAIGSGQQALTSPLSLYEASMAIAREVEIAPTAARDRVMRFLRGAGIDIAPITLDVSSAAVLAAERFGKGRHKAKLNMGDCFSYAMASSRRARLLFVGDDFTLTDIPPALDAPN